MTDQVPLFSRAPNLVQWAVLFWLQVSLQSRMGEHFCGGTLVEKGNSTFIITAAHCMRRKRAVRNPRTVFILELLWSLSFIRCIACNFLKFQFRVMADDTSIAFEKPPGSRRQYRLPKMVIVHPEYEETEGTPNDIAIIIVSDYFSTPRQPWISI